jgi:hypothetical protein
MKFPRSFIIHHFSDPQMIQILFAKVADIIALAAIFRTEKNAVYPRELGRMVDKKLVDHPNTRVGDHWIGDSISSIK